MIVSSHISPLSLPHPFSNDTVDFGGKFKFKLGWIKMLISVESKLSGNFRYKVRRDADDTVTRRRRRRSSYHWEEMTQKSENMLFLL